MLLLSLFISAALAQNQCYYAPDRRAGSAIIPCSSGSGVAACCQFGDLCLADSACWNPVHNVTYLYGCTDASYTDQNCPYKCGPAFENAPYVGLDYCANTTRNEWSCTHPPTSDPAIAAFPAQQCYNDSVIAFAGPSSLQPILSLPTNIGGPTVFFSQVNPTSYQLVSGYTPTSTPRPTVSVPSSVEYLSSTRTSGSATATGTSTGTSTVEGSSSNPTQSSSPSSGLSTGAKAGIGAGIGGAALAIAAVVIAWMILRRRRSASATKDYEASSGAYTASSEKNKPVQDGPSELPLNERKPSPAPPSELPDSESVDGAPAPRYTAWTRPQPGQQVYELPTETPK